MRTITLHCHAKNSGGTYSESIRVDDRTSEEIKKRKEEIFEAAENALNDSRYYQVECWGDLTEEEEELLAELDLEIDF